jgi:hypothetical protein
LSTENPAAVSKEQEKRLPVQVFQQMEVLDENQILAEMKGADLLNEFVYDIVIEGRHVTNLSYAGVKEAIRRRGKYEILDFRVEDDKDQYRCTVRMRDLIRQIDVLGASTCEKGKPFAYTLAVNKAERNAFRKLIPEKLIAGMVKDFLERKKPRPVTTQPVPAKEEATSSEPANHDMKSQQPVTTPNHAIPAEGTKPTTETPVPATASPEPVKHSWHVPLTTNQLLPFHIEKGIRQIFLAKGLQSFGVVNQDTVNNELAIVPEKLLDPEAGPVHWLIEGTPYRKGVVKPVCEKHGLQYELVLEGNLLKAIVIFGGSLDQEHVKEIAGGATWAFQRAFEEAK